MSRRVLQLLYPAVIFAVYLHFCELYLYRDFWFDEALTVLNFALQENLIDIYWNYPIPNNQILFTFLVRLWLTFQPIGMESTLWLRLLPCLLGGATLAAIYCLFKSRVGGGKILLPVQGILSAASLVQLWRTQMLPVLYLVILAALLFLLWLLVKRCQEYNVPGKVSRVFSVFLCACMALGCVWAQQGLTALDNMTNGLLTGAEANKITKEPFVIYLSGVDTRGELTEKARSDVNILAVVNPQTKQVALINTPRDYYVDLAGTNSKDKLTHAGLYGVETSMATLGNLYGVSVDHYIRINFAGFISVVDALGGVDVYSDQAFTSVGSPGYYDPTTFVEGWNHLDGKAALALPGSATPLPPAISSAASTR